MLKLKLPFPISANRYWQIVGKRLIKTKQARQFIAEVVYLWITEKSKGTKSFNDNDNLALAVEVHYPIKRGPDTDLDNLCKVLIDAMETAQIFPNDKQFKHIQLTRASTIDPKGGVIVWIKKCNDYHDVKDDNIFSFLVKGIHNTGVNTYNKIT